MAATYDWRSLSANPRTLIEAEIERLIGLLDAMDGDPDLEPELDGGCDPDLEPDSDGEPWLGWFDLPDGGIATGGVDDLEEECYA